MAEPSQELIALVDEFGTGAILYGESDGEVSYAVNRMAKARNALVSKLAELEGCSSKLDAEMKRTAEAVELARERTNRGDSWREMCDELTERLKIADSRLSSCELMLKQRDAEAASAGLEAQQLQYRLGEAVNLLRCLVESFDASVTRKAAEFVAANTPRVSAESVRGILASGGSGVTDTFDESVVARSEAASVVERTRYRLSYAADTARVLEATEKAFKDVCAERDRLSSVLDQVSEELELSDDEHALTARKIIEEGVVERQSPEIDMERTTVGRPTRYAGEPKCRKWSECLGEDGHEPPCWTVTPD